MTTIDDFTAGFLEEPGYLDYARVGPLSAAALAELTGSAGILSRARFGSLEPLLDEDARLREAVAEVTGFPAEQVVFQPNTSTGLMQVMFALTGGVLLSRDEFPSLTFAAVRAEQALHAATPVWLETDHGRVTPGQIREQITATTAAVAVSLVDYRTGYLADLEGIRQVIGDRLLIVDAIQGMGVADAPYEVADVVVSGGQKWLRAGWGTGFLALSDSALERLTPVMSGHAGAAEVDPWGTVGEPADGSRAFSVSNPDFVAEARLAAALEEVSALGVGAIRSAVSEGVEKVIALADEFAVPVASSRVQAERAGIVVLQPAADELTVLTASFFNHGVTVTTRGGGIRLSVHAATSEETLNMVRQALVSFGTAR
ncbi:aminotransferase class V-fold PLP-dependent enzyme [Microbacterium sp. STN6]|uniref:aminotransferase class V-fold PLP-dependent enzyme n=1 Tax=Microbacterium sp. STN6 TaxID=2995588 RepID=UPI002260B833|nr:aminotransferase class V-fold PLP-dependent enzyme [Microbacterium sp. STN6]MCX7521866.1 aminotransferase class V-fold PLP-dependent enzyme [Microbacterium sp. STN6]